MVSKAPAAGNPKSAAPSSFPADFSFRGTWRGYQERVLSALPAHLDDRRLHVVAAPGCGKTILGLEVVRRLARPALIVSPTLAIREQWLQRLVEHFLPKGAPEPAWVSRDPREPGLITVCTYQALHAALAGKPETDEQEQADGSDEPAPDQDPAPNPPMSDRGDLPRALRASGIGTLVLDEAHHLRREWWRALVALRDELSECTVVSLTATPPYDVPPSEWERYEDICGPVDVEIPTPELVLSGDLCPHQDYVFLNLPSEEENERISAFRARMRELVQRLREVPDFTSHLASHPYVTAPKEHLEEVLETPEFFSSIVIFLREQGVDASDLAHVLGHRGGSSIPGFDLEWAETLLTGVLFRNSAFGEAAASLSGFHRDLAEAGAIDHRCVRLRRNDRVEKILRASIRKLDALGEIVRMESASLGQELRMVILTDYIHRADLPESASDERRISRIGVAPIFETVRRLDLAGIRLGVLTGSFVIVPASAVRSLERAVGKADLDLTPLPHDPSFLSLDVTDSDRSRIVRAMTDLFETGALTVLIGSKALLGEGWDAPAINALVLASFVASYVLSNQMRGRAIRALPGRPDKTANVWHLVCVEPGAVNGGEDYQMLTRRFEAFVGVSAEEPVIESRVARLGLGEPPFGDGSAIDEVNRRTLSRARDRAALRRLWEIALGAGSEGRLVQQIDSARVRLPRRWVFWSTITALFWFGVNVALFVAMEGMRGLQGVGRHHPADLVTAAILVLGVSLVAGLPFCLKALWLALRHGRVESSMSEVGTAVLDSLCESGIIRTRREDLSLTAIAEEHGNVVCFLEGGAPVETAAFIEAMRELLSPIENPRYILTRQSPGTLWLRRDYHAVPEALGARKEYAERFARSWRRRVGSATLTFTRSIEGRQLLLRARNHSVSGALGPPPRRMARWR
jgi:superfamily II DNA or RNA helicase